MRKVGFDGQIIAELSFDEDETGGPINPVWVFADGSVIGNVDPIHIIYKADQEFRTVKPFEFHRKFPNALLPKSISPQLLLRQLFGE